MFDFQQKLVSPEELKRLLPLPQAQKIVKEKNDAALAQAFYSRDKFIVVCGPCAADDADAVHAYSEMLGSLAQKVKDKILLVQRVFTAKPRSLGEGYLGMLFGRGKDGQTDVNKGLADCRKLFIDCIKTNSLPVADELLFLEQYEYFGDLVSYYFLGARTSESTPHRAFVSGLGTPVGIKNPTSGNLESLAQALYSARNPKTCLLRGSQYQTDGNPLVHAVMRGQTGENCRYKANCDKKSLERFFGFCARLNMDKPFVLIDCSHGNSGKSPDRQIENALYAVTELRAMIGGIMLESYINEGSAPNMFGVSKTDPCLSFGGTEKLLLEIHSLLPQR